MTVALSSPPKDAHVAACGLFCSNCGRFKKGKCEGCQIAPAWASCPVRACCAERRITTCAECTAFAAPGDFHDCKKLNNFIAKVFAFVFGSDRLGSLVLLRDKGMAAYLAEKHRTGKH
ncbi:MAG: DUF3795 domain-containing protein [Myxococcales bacterium]|nr:MAG: DUF3795 domain-containing protein [Myxococcales bacterium]